MESNRVVVAFERRQTRAKGGMTDVGNISTPVDARVADEETRARPRSRAIDGGDTKSPNDGVDASNREDDERNAVVGTCRVCLEDISREDVEMGKVVSLGCACVSSGRVHDTVGGRDAYVAARRRRRRARARFVCVHSRPRSSRSIDPNARSSWISMPLIVRDAREFETRDEASLEIDRSTPPNPAVSRARVRERLRVRRVRVRATRERFCARAHRSRRARVRESRSTDVTRVDGERRASPAVRLADFAPEGNDGRDRIRVGIHRRRRRPRRDNEIEGRRGNARDAWTRARGRERARRRRETRKIRLLGTDRSIGFEQTSRSKRVMTDVMRTPVSTPTSGTTRESPFASSPPTSSATSDREAAERLADAIRDGLLFATPEATTRHWTARTPGSGGAKTPTFAFGDVDCAVCQSPLDRSRPEASDNPDKVELVTGLARADTCFIDVVSWSVECTV